MIRVAIVIYLMGLIVAAHAQSGGWVDQLKNSNGMVCCYDNDGRRLDDPEWRTKGNSYEVLFKEGWVEVPDYAVVQGRNQDGIARVWSEIGRMSNGTPKRQIRCFLVGSLS